MRTKATTVLEEWNFVTTSTIGLEDSRTSRSCPTRWSNSCGSSATGIGQLAMHAELWKADGLRGTGCDEYRYIRS